MLNNKLEELMNNYNYLLEAVKNNQITPDDAVKTLESLSVVDEAGKIWKINLYGEYIAGNPGSELVKEDPYNFNNNPYNFNNNIESETNYNIPPEANSIKLYGDISNKKKTSIKKERIKGNIFLLRKLRTPLIVITCILVVFVFYSKSDSRKINDNILSTDNKEISLNDIVNNSNETIIEIEEEADSKIYKKDNQDNVIIDENDISNKKNIKYIEKIFIDISKNINKFKSSDESVEQIYLRRAQIEGYLSVGLKLSVDKIIKSEDKYLYFISVKLDDKIVLTGKGELFGYNKNESNFIIGWPEFKREK